MECSGQYRKLSIFIPQMWSKVALRCQSFQVDLPVLSQYRSEKDGENIGIIDENKLINGLEINLECVIIIFSHRILVFKRFLHPSINIGASCPALISTSGCNKGYTPQTHD